MSTFTLFIIIVMIVAGVLGWMSGFIKQVGQLAGVVLGIAVCRIIGPACAAHFYGAEASAADRVLYTVLTYIVLFIATYIIVLLVARLMRGMLGAVHLGFIDKIAGSVFRIAEWLLMLSLLLNVWESFSPVTSLADNPVYVRMLWFGPWLLGTDTVLKIGSAISSTLSL